MEEIKKVLIFIFKAIFAVTLMGFTVQINDMIFKL